MWLEGLHDSYVHCTVRGICTFAVFFRSLDLFVALPALVFEGHFVLCYKEKIEPSDRAMANFKRS